MTALRLCAALAGSEGCALRVAPLEDPIDAGDGGSIADATRDSAPDVLAFDQGPEAVLLDGPFDALDRGVDTRTDVVDVRVVCPTGMVGIPADTFVMGQTAPDPESFSTEQPAHFVTLRAYCMDATEVTVAAYRACADCTPPAVDTGCNWSVAGRDNHPVNCVDWDQAAAFCAARGARLPTEAEWEHAARGADARKFPWGNDEPTCTRLNFTEPTGACVGATVPVGSYPSGRSAFGLDDMAGNVWEWVNDFWDPNYYATAAAAGPNPQGPDSGDARVRRGGGIDSYAGEVRASMRNANVPVARYPHIGFRCAADAQ